MFTKSPATHTLNIGSGTRADRLREGSLPSDERTVQRWFDTEAFAAPGPQRVGNAGRNILRGPGRRQVDCSLFKAFPFSKDGGRRVEFRAEAFNLTNTPQFINPSSTFGAAGFGTITSADIFWHYPHYHPGGATPYTAVRSGDWKFIEFQEDGRCELYNLKQDPSETQDLASRDSKRVRELRARRRRVIALRQSLIFKLALAARPGCWCTFEHSWG